VRISPRKANLVLRLIRGHQVDRAQEILSYTKRPIAKTISKVLTSAVANATSREEPPAVEQLYIKQAVADTAPTMKRFQPRAHGRAFSILKRTSHIRIVVAEHETAAK
jgi:large subunit ribosomal protein L22